MGRSKLSSKSSVPPHIKQNSKSKHEETSSTSRKIDKLIKKQEKSTTSAAKLNAVQMDPPAGRRRMGRANVPAPESESSSSPPAVVDSLNDANATGAGPECRRSSRKKTIKFDVRDLLNKNRKSHKIQIEARIDSNAPKQGAVQVSKEEMDSKQKNFIEKSAIFRRYSISENKLPPRPPPPPPVALIQTIQQCVGELEQLPLDGDIDLATISPIARRLSKTKEILSASIMKPKQVSSLIVTKLENVRASPPTRARAGRAGKLSDVPLVKAELAPKRRGRQGKLKGAAHTSDAMTESSNESFDTIIAVDPTEPSTSRAVTEKPKEDILSNGRAISLSPTSSTKGIDLNETIDASAVTLQQPTILEDCMLVSNDDMFVAAEEEVFTELLSSDGSMQGSPKGKSIDEISLFARSNSTETNSSDDSENRRRKVRVSVKRVSLTATINETIEEPAEDSTYEEKSNVIEILSSNDDDSLKAVCVEEESNQDFTKIREARARRKNEHFLTDEGDNSNSTTLSSIVVLSSASATPVEEFKEKTEQRIITRRAKTRKQSEDAEEVMGSEKEPQTMAQVVFKDSTIVQEVDSSSSGLVLLPSLQEISKTSEEVPSSSTNAPVVLRSQKNIQQSDTTPFKSKDLLSGSNSKAAAKTSNDTPSSSTGSQSKLRSRKNVDQTDETPHDLGADPQSEAALKTPDKTPLSLNCKEVLLRSGKNVHRTASTTDPTQESSEAGVVQTNLRSSLRSRTEVTTEKVDLQTSRKSGQIISRRKETASAALQEHQQTIETCVEIQVEAQSSQTRTRSGINVENVDLPQQKSAMLSKNPKEEGHGSTTDREAKLRSEVHPRRSALKLLKNQKVTDQLAPRLDSIRKVSPIKPIQAADDDILPPPQTSGLSEPAVEKPIPSQPVQRSGGGSLRNRKIVDKQEAYDLSLQSKEAADPVNKSQPSRRSNVSLRNPKEVGNTQEVPCTFLSKKELQQETTSTEIISQEPSSEILLKDSIAIRSNKPEPSSQSLPEDSLKNLNQPAEEAKPSENLEILNSLVPTSPCNLDSTPKTAQQTKDKQTRPYPKSKNQRRSARSLCRLKQFKNDSSDETAALQPNQTSDEETQTAMKTPTKRRSARSLSPRSDSTKFSSQRSKQEPQSASSNKRRSARQAHQEPTSSPNSQTSEEEVQSNKVAASTVVRTRSLRKQTPSESIIRLEPVAVSNKEPDLSVAEPPFETTDESLDSHKVDDAATTSDRSSTDTSTAGRRESLRAALRASLHTDKTIHIERNAKESQPKQIVSDQTSSSSESSECQELVHKGRFQDSKNIVAKLKDETSSVCSESSTSSSSTSSSMSSTSSSSSSSSSTPSSSSTCTSTTSSSSTSTSEGRATRSKKIQPGVDEAKSQATLYSSRATTPRKSKSSSENSQETIAVKPRQAEELFTEPDSECSEISTQAKSSSPTSKAVNDGDTLSKERAKLIQRRKSMRLSRWAATLEDEINETASDSSETSLSFIRTRSGKSKVRGNESDNKDTANKKKNDAQVVPVKDGNLISEQPNIVVICNQEKLLEIKKIPRNKSKRRTKRLEPLNDILPKSSPLSDDDTSSSGTTSSGTHLLRNIRARRKTISDTNDLYEVEANASFPIGSMQHQARKSTDNLEQIVASSQSSMEESKKLLRQAKQTLENVESMLRKDSKNKFDSKTAATDDAMTFTAEKKDCALNIVIPEDSPPTEAPFDVLKDVKELEVKKSDNNHELEDVTPSDALASEEKAKMNMEPEKSDNKQQLEEVTPPDASASEEKANKSRQISQHQDLYPDMVEEHEKYPTQRKGIRLHVKNADNSSTEEPEKELQKYTIPKPVESPKTPRQRKKGTVLPKTPKTTKSGQDDTKEFCKSVEEVNPTSETPNSSTIDKVEIVFTNLANSPKEEESVSSRMSKGDDVKKFVESSPTTRSQRIARKSVKIRELSANTVETSDDIGVNDIGADSVDLSKAYADDPPMSAQTNIKLPEVPFTSINIGDILEHNISDQLGFVKEKPEEVLNSNSSSTTSEMCDDVSTSISQENASSYIQTVESEKNTITEIRSTQKTDELAANESDALDVSAVEEYPDTPTGIQKPHLKREINSRKKKKCHVLEVAKPQEEDHKPNTNKDFTADIDPKPVFFESNQSDEYLKPDQQKVESKPTPRRQLDSSFIESLEKSLFRPSCPKKASKKKETTVVTSPIPKGKDDSLLKTKKIEDPKKPEPSSPKTKKKPKVEKKVDDVPTPKRKSITKAKDMTDEQQAAEVAIAELTEFTKLPVCLKAVKSKAETKFYPEEPAIETPIVDQRPTISLEKDLEKEKSPDSLPDPLKDIEKFIEDGVNLLKRGYKLDDDDETALDRNLLKTDDLVTPKKCKLDEAVEEKKSQAPEDDNSNSNSECSIQATTPTSETDTPNGIRRSHRIKNNSKSTKCLVGRGLVRDKERFSTKDDEKTVYSINDQKLDLAEVEAKNSKFLKDMEERLSNFRVIRENEYKCERVISKEAKRMLCDCFLTTEEEERGELGCGEDCLNRLLMIECGSDCTVRHRCTNRRFTKFLYSPCRVFRTEKKGFGIMADIEILPGEFIMEYVGEVINGDEFENRRTAYSQDKNKHYYFMALRSDAIIDATAKGNISRFINHSCDPNAETQKWTVNGELRIGFFSRKSIMPGEEITFDYQYQRYGKEAQKCYCESFNCRGWIGEEPSSEEEEEELDDEEGESEETEEEEEEQEQTVPVAPLPAIPIPIVAAPIAEQLLPSVSEVPQVLANDKDMDIATGMDITLPVSVTTPLPIETVAIEPPKDLQLKKKREKKRLLERKVDKIKRREAKQFLEDPDIEDEVRFLVKCGLKNQADTLRLSRLIVRAKLLETRLKLLHILRNGELPCRRLFLDYHGLRLLHGWMSEVIDTRDTEKSMEIRMVLLSVLECLPISNKTMLTDSKVYQTVSDWSNNKESHSPSDESPKELGAHSTSPTRSEDSSSELQKLAAKLVNTWDNLPEIFRIPKRERIEQMKEHEREADKGLDDDVSRSSGNRNRARFSRNSGPNCGSGGRFKWSRGDKDKERERDRRRYTQNLNGSGKDGGDKTTAGESQLSKEQRRELFAAKVARDEAEKRLAEERREFDIKCRFFGLDPKRMRPENMPFCVNPSTGQWYSFEKKPISTPPSYAHVQVPVKPKSTNPDDYRLPPMDLPPLWKYAITPNGKIYYYHVKIRIPQWEPPIKILPLAGQANIPVKNSESDSSNAECADSSEDDIEVIKGLDPVKLQAYIEMKILDRRLQRYTRLVEEKPISPRKEEDRIYNQIEVRKYKENKEKIRKRKEEIRRRRDLLVKGNPLDASSLDTAESEETPVNALPIQDYLISSDEEEIIKAECNNSPLIDKIVQGDKIVDELDALKSKRPFKRPLPIRERYEHKKRKLDKNKESSKSTKRSKDGEGSSSSKYRKIKEKFRCEIAGIIVQHLKPYRKETCFSGRILTDDDFNHLARKLTHFVMVKEMKYCESIGQTLVVTESVKNKSREFIKKYMAKYGGVYVRPKNDPEYKEIPFL